MSYYWFNRKELWKKGATAIEIVAAKKKMLSNIIKTEVLSKDARNRFRACQEKEKNIKRRIRRISKETDITWILKS